MCVSCGSVSFRYGVEEAVQRLVFQCVWCSLGRNEMMWCAVTEYWQSTNDSSTHHINWRDAHITFLHAPQDHCCKLRHLLVMLMVWWNKATDTASQTLMWSLTYVVNRCASMGVHSTHNWTSFVTTDTVAHTWTSGDICLSCGKVRWGRTPQYAFLVCVCNPVHPKHARLNCTNCCACYDVLIFAIAVQDPHESNY